MTEESTLPILSHATFLLPRGEWSAFETPSLHLSIQWRGLCKMQGMYFDGEITTLHDDGSQMTCGNLYKYKEMNYTEAIVKIMKQYFPSALSLWFHPDKDNYHLISFVFDDEFGWEKHSGDMGKTDYGISLNLQRFDEQGNPLELQGV